MKKALITGITGQDGSYLAELLLDKGYEVHGIIRRASTFNTGRVNHIFQDPHEKNKRLILHYGDLSDGSNVSRLIEKVKPDEIYNLAAQSHVRVSFDIPEYTGDVTGLGTLRILDAIKEAGVKTKFYQASSSEMFGKVQEVPQKETTPFYPRSPYGCAKVYAYWMTINYRESYNIFACNGILFNHESPRRGETFVTRKITRGLSRVKLGVDDCLYLGNLDAKRDWGYARDYVEGMWLMLQQEQPDDYVLATNETHSVREFVEEAAKILDFNLVWIGEGLGEKGIDRKTGKILIQIDPRYFRPAEVDLLIGDYSKAKSQLGWEPKVNFKELVKIMIQADFENEKPVEKKSPVKLIKSSFYHEVDTKKKLADFIIQAPILSMGEECKKYEQAFSQKQERKHALFVSSGSSANLLLIQALLNLGVFKKGDRVGFSAITWATNAMPIIQLGLTPVAIGCELNTLNISPDILKTRIDEIRCLFLTNVLGFSDKIDEIRQLCLERNVILLEDNCESLGSRTRGTLLGNFGLASTFSSFVGHHLSTIEGGFVCTDNTDLYNMLVVTRAHGWDRNLSPETQQALRAQNNIDDFFAKYTFYDLAYNARPTEINGFLGNIQIQYWDEIVNKRAENFKRFQTAVESNNDFIPLCLNHMDLVSNFAMPVICKSKEIFGGYKNKFEENQVEIRPIIAGNITKQPFYKKYVSNIEECENADFIHQHGFYFGNNPEMIEDELNLITGLLTK